MDVLERLLLECRGLTHAGAPSAALRDATSLFLKDVVASGAIPDAALGALGELPVYGAGWLAVTFGSAVEAGVPPVAAEHLIALLRRWLPLLQDEDEAVTGAMNWLAPAVVAHVARRGEYRAELAMDGELMDALDGCAQASDGALFIHALLLRRSGELMVLRAESGRALRLRFHNVAQCFHLFTLLQCAIGTGLPGGKEPSSLLDDAARHVRHSTEGDEAWWHYQTGGAEAHLGNSVWGEGHVDSLPRFDGVYVICLWPPVLGGRYWNAGFFGPGLSAAPTDMQVVEELSPSDAAAWFARTGMGRHSSHSGS
ncbi:MAG: hypothetical protein R3B72_04555 [Polyangiaceae bacterium]